MLKSIRIKNFKSIIDEKIELGRINVFIGANGVGKSSVIEAIGFASAIADNGRIHNDALIDKGVRTGKPSLMRSSFFGKKSSNKITISLKGEDSEVNLNLIPSEDENIYTQWVDEDILNSYKYLTEFYKNLATMKNVDNFDKFLENIQKIARKDINSETSDRLELANSDLRESILNLIDQGSHAKQKYTGYLSDFFKKWIANFVIYMPNTLTLRGIVTESYAEPIGIHGEGLDMLLEQCSEEEKSKIYESTNKLIDWVQDIGIAEQGILEQQALKMNKSDSNLFFTDRYMQKSNNKFSSENANEGILHLLFYFTLVISNKTPNFFAIDNVDTALNPSICRFLMTEICQLSKTYNKQLLLTTHNPAILDGLNLNDEEIKLFEVRRSREGSTKIREIITKPNVTDQKYKLSELWTRGYLGAINKEF